MREGQYVAVDSPEQLEQERLDALEEMHDPITRRRLRGVGLGSAWRCLEVGAGQGSILRWLAEEVGPSGHVVGVDLNPRFLRKIDLPNVEVRKHDVLEQDFESQSYDLVHCRALLMHLPKPDVALARMAAAVRPGGWLVIEEADFGTFSAADPSHSGAEEFNRTTRKCWDAACTIGTMDSYFGRRIPSLVEGLGFEATGHDGLIRVGRGGDHPIGRFWSLSFRLPGVEALVSKGVVTQEELGQVRALLLDPSFEFMSSVLFGAWGRRPAGGQ